MQPHPLAQCQCIGVIVLECLLGGRHAATPTSTMPIYIYMCHGANQTEFRFAAHWVKWTLELTKFESNGISIWLSLHQLVPSLGASWCELSQITIHLTQIESSQNSIWLNARSNKDRLGHLLNIPWWWDMLQLRAPYLHDATFLYLLEFDDIILEASRLTLRVCLQCYWRPSL